MREGSLLCQGLSAGALFVCLGSAASAQVTALEGSYGAGLQFGAGGVALTANTSATAKSETSTRAVSLTGRANLSFYDDDTDIGLSGQLVVNQQMPNASLSFGANLAVDPVTFETIDDDLGLSTGEGDRTRLSAFSNYTRQINENTQFVSGLSYTLTDFDPVNEEQVPSDLIRGNARVNYTLDPRTTVFGAVSVGWFTSELTDAVGAFENNSLSVEGSVGGNQEIDSRTKVNGELGVTFVNIEEITGGLTTTNWEAALLIDAGLEQSFADGVLSLGLSQEVSPVASGELQQVSKITAGVSVEVNRSTEIGLNGTFTRQSGLGRNDAVTGLSIEPFYSREIIEGVNATASYTLRSADSTTSHRFNLGFSRSFGGPL